MKRLPPTLRAIVCFLLEFCMALPLLWIFTGPMVPAMTLLFPLILLAAGLLGILIRRFIPAPILQLAMGLPLCFLVPIWIGLAVAGRSEPASFVLPGLFAPFVYYRGRQHVQNDWNAILPVYAPAVVMTITFLLMALFQYLGTLEGYMPWLAIFGAVSLGVSFYAMNHINRRNLADDQRTGSDAAAVSRRLSPQNIALLGVLMAVGFLLTCTPWLYHLFQRLFGLIMRAVSWIFEMLFHFEPPPPSGEVGAAESPQLPMGGEIPERPFWDAFFTVLAYILGIAAAVAMVILIILAIRNGIRLLLELLRKFMDQRGLLTDSSSDFEDTHESLVQLRELPKKYLDDLRSRLRHVPRWGELKTEGERVRFLYRLSLRRAEKAGYRHRSSYTARESLDEAAASLPQIQPVEDRLRQTYDQVRYGEAEPPAGSAEAMRRDANL